MSVALVGLRVVLALACVLVLIWFAGRKLSGTSGVRRSRSMPLTVIGRQSLGKGAGVALIEVAGRVLLLGVSDQGVRVLTEIDVPAPEPVVIADLPVPDDAAVVLREEIDLATLVSPYPDGSSRLTDPVELAQLAGLAAASSARGASALHGSILSPDTWRRAVDVVQQRTVRR